MQRAIYPVGLLIAVVPLMAQIRLGPIPSAASGLLAAYAMSNATDASGNGHTATFLNTTTTPGRYNDAQAFNGNTSRMTIPGVTLSTAFTIECWVKLTGLTRGVVGRAAPREVAYWQAILYRSLDNVFIAEAGSFLTAGFTNTAGTLTQIVSPSPTTSGVFHHVAATYDGAMLTLFVDGLAMASRAATGAVQTNANPLEAGSSAIDGGYMAGVVDDVRIYGRALTASEIDGDLATPVDTVREDVVSWDLEVYTKDAPAATGGSAIAEVNVLRTAATCNLAPLPPPTGPVRNPTTARVTDPAASTRECELGIDKLVFALPVGTGYTSLARARGMTTVSGPSPASNPFDRVAVAIPPAAPGSTVIVK